LGDDGDGGELQPVQEPAAPARLAERARAVSESEHQQGRGQGEARPGGEAAERAAAHQADGEARLAGGWAGKKLRQRDQLGESALANPPALRDELGAEIADVGDRPAEGSQAELEEGEEDVAGRFDSRKASGEVVRRIVRHPFPAACARARLRRSSAAGKDAVAARRAQVGAASAAGRAWLTKG